MQPEKRYSWVNEKSRKLLRLLLSQLLLKTGIRVLTLVLVKTNSINRVIFCELSLVIYQKLFQVTFALKPFYLRPCIFPYNIGF
jgi:hypothetical protein